MNVQGSKLVFRWTWCCLSCYLTHDQLGRIAEKKGSYLDCCHTWLLKYWTFLILVSRCTYLHLYDRDYSNETARSYSNETIFEDYVTQSRFLYVVACANKSVENRIFMKINISSEGKYFDLV